MTVLFWGVYGVLLHMGRGLLLSGSTPPTAEDANAGLKAFLFVCVAYGITGVIALILLKVRGSDFSFNSAGINWSIIAGLAGALGAFTLVLALGAAGPIYKAAAAGAVMPIVFGGAPIVNAVVAMIKQGTGFKNLPPLFILGILLASGGAVLVAKFAPTNTGAAPKPGLPAAAPAKH